MNLKLGINEIFFSIQGESTHSGRPCVFIRTAGCPLRCSWCDTEYAFSEGKSMSFDEITSAIEKFPTKLVELTGGEPLAQPQSIEFLKVLENKKYEILLETSGAYSIEHVPASVKIILDLKAPASNEASKNLLENFKWLKSEKDEIKFVVANLDDFNFAVDLCRKHELFDKAHAVLISPVMETPKFKGPELKEVAKWVLDSALPFRYQLQMHKFIWGSEVRGV